MLSLEYHKKAVRGSDGLTDNIVFEAEEPIEPLESPRGIVEMTAMITRLQCMRPLNIYNPSYATISTRCLHNTLSVHLPVSFPSRVRLPLVAAD